MGFALLLFLNDLWNTGTGSRVDGLEEITHSKKMSNCSPPFFFPLSLLPIKNRSAPLPPSSLPPPLFPFHFDKRESSQSCNLPTVVKETLLRGFFFTDNLTYLHFKFARVHKYTIDFPPEFY